MKIHVVQAGETLEMIAGIYKIPSERLILENGITNPHNLVEGQTIVIIDALITHTAKEEEPLPLVATMYGVTVMHLLRNNPNLSGRNVLLPNETIVIQYDTNIKRSTMISGFAHPFIRRDVLRKTLPYLTYLTIFDYKLTPEGELIDIDDIELIEIAKEYGVASIMTITTLSEHGVHDEKLANFILDNPEIQDKLIDQAIIVMKTKGYIGLNIYYQGLNSINLSKVEELTKKISMRVKAEGLLFVITVSPKTILEGTEASIEKVDYSNLCQYVEAVLFLSYNWSYSYGPPASSAPMNIVRSMVEYFLSVVPPEMTDLGFPVIGYDWELPYIPGSTMARAITYDTAIELAILASVPIFYSDISAAPYFFYKNEMQQHHLVWFKDSRSIQALTSLITEFNLMGFSIWNIMRFFNQLWFVVNNNFEIVKVDSIPSPVTPIS
ncbi:MAG: LysM peptidoglycan-binding domain-containing protein [Mobilitalea sp.]